MVANKKSNVLSPTNAQVVNVFLTALVCVLAQPENNEQLVLSANASLNSIIYA